MSISVLALEKDLFFSVKIRDTLRHHGIVVKTARSLAAFEQYLHLPDERPTLAIVNIAIQGVDWESAIQKACAQEVPVLAFGSHMDLQAREKALKAGAKKVVANSKFTTDMVGLVHRVLNKQPQIEASSEASQMSNE